MHGFALDVASFAALEERRKAAQVRADALRAERNAKSKNIGRAKAQGQDVAPLLKEVETLGSEQAAAEAEFAAVQVEVESARSLVPGCRSRPGRREQLESELGVLGSRWVSGR